MTKYACNLVFCLSRAEDGYDKLFDPQKMFMSTRPLHQAYEDRNVSECFFSSLVVLSRYACILVFIFSF